MRRWTHLVTHTYIFVIPLLNFFLSKTAKLLQKNVKKLSEANETTKQKTSQSNKKLSDFIDHKNVQTQVTNLRVCWKMIGNTTFFLACMMTYDSYQFGYKNSFYLL